MFQSLKYWRGFGFCLFLLMVQLMGSLHSGKIEDFTEEEYGSLSKRSRLAAAPLDQVILIRG